MRVPNPSVRRAVRRASLAVAASAAAIVACAGLAVADCGPGIGSGTDSAYVAPSNSHSTATWNNVTKYLTLSAYGTAMASNSCVTGWFDWGVPGGSSHYDARAARVCRNGSSYGGSWNENPIVAGIQKYGTCYAINNADLAHSTCTRSGLSTCPLSVSPVLPNNVTSYYILNANGSTAYWASNPTSPTS